MSQRVVQFQDSEVPTERVLHRTRGNALVYSSPFVVRPGSKVPLDDFFSLDFAWPRYLGDVIVGSDEATRRVQAEASAEPTFYTGNQLQLQLQLQLSNREDGLAEVLSIYRSGRGTRWEWIRERLRRLTEKQRRQEDDSLHCAPDRNSGKGICSSSEKVAAGLETAALIRRGLPSVILNLLPSLPLRTPI